MTKSLQYIHASLLDYYKKIRYREEAGQERLKIIHNETKGKVAFIGVGKLINQNNLNRALDTRFSKFITVGWINMFKKNFGILLRKKWRERN